MVESGPLLTQYVLLESVVLRFHPEITFADQTVTVVGKYQTR